MVLGLPGDSENLIRPVDLTDDKVPMCYLAHTLGESNRTCLLDCDLRYDQNGERWETIGLPYEGFCRTHNADFQGKVGNEPNQKEARMTIASRSGYNWDPFKVVALEDATACHTTGAPFSPGGWLQRAKKKVDTCSRPVYTTLTGVMRQSTSFTRHVAGTTENIAVSPHGWTLWRGMLRKLETARDNNSSENTIFTQMDADCSGVLHGRGGESAIGAGIAKERCLVLCSDVSGEIIASRAQHGVSARICVSMAVTYARCSHLCFKPCLFILPYDNNDRIAPHCCVRVEVWSAYRIDAPRVSTLGPTFSQRAKVGS